MNDLTPSPTLVLLSLAPCAEAPFPISEARTPSSHPPRTDSLPFRSPGEDYDLETCAIFAAERAWRRTGGFVPVTQDEAAITKSDRYWVEFADSQAMASNVEYLQAYDSAFVRRLEQLRGPLTAEDFAAAVGAAEPGAAITALGQAALARVMREWMSRLSSDPEFGSSLE